MDRKQIVGVVAGVILLALLVGPRFLPSETMTPLTLSIVRYLVDTETGQMMVELKARNETRRPLRCDAFQFEFLDREGHWKPARHDPVPPPASFAAREEKLIRAKLPIEATLHSWRIGMGCVVYPSIPEKYLAQALVFLKWRDTDRSSSVSILLSPDFPPPNPPLGTVVPRC